MKIRTDFVTNSSSSSFVAVLELQLENGKKIRATHDNSVGEGDLISYFPGSYRFPRRSLANMKGCYVKNPDQMEKNSPEAWLKIVNGTLRLMCHTYGEEAYRAYPDQMLPELGYEWSTILNQARKCQNEEQLFAYLRGLDTLQDYTDKSLHDVARYIMTDDYNDTLIIQRLNETGTLSLSVETASDEDASLFSFREPRWHPEPSNSLEFITEEEYLRKAQKQRQKEEERRRRAEKKPLQVERARNQEEARRLRAEEKQRKVEQVMAQKEEARRIRDEEKQRQQAARLEAKAEKERLAAEAKAQRDLERQETIANAVILYAPGEEPEKLRARLDTLFAKLDGAYPDRRISRLNQDHKKWGETVTELYRLLGYPDSQAFLEAYGYTIEKNAGGRPTSVDPAAIIEELHRRYPNGGAESLDALKRENPDIPWKTLANNAKEYFGTTLVSHLKNIELVARK